jgi:hypothetical protein
VGTVLSAPFAIADHRERLRGQIDMIGDHFGALGRSVEDVAAPQ